jgi:hypothetical protein
VFCRDVVIGADHATLEDRKVALNRVRVPEIAAHVFLDAVVDAAVTGELAATTL